MRHQAVGLRLQLEEEAKVGAADESGGEVAVAGLAERDAPVEAGNEARIDEGLGRAPQPIEPVREIGARERRFLRRGGKQSEEAVGQARS
jgi:hypothetical protein